jgi:diguanylate cyclase (GGDEF)-like protein
MTTILVIEDMDALREEIAEILSFEGFAVLTAANGRIGVELAEKHHPDLVVCDIAMPELDGYGTLSALRANPQTATTPFIFLTAKVSKADMRQGMDLGADDYLTKPFTAQELLAAIDARLKKNADLVKQLFQHDTLTNLPNAFAFYEVLRQAIAQHQQLALFFLDIDHFNLINNTLGYAVGDQLFQAVANRLQATDQAKLWLIGRLRGDEFALAVPNLSDTAQITELGRQLLQLIRQPFHIYGQEIFLSASVGIAMYPHHAQTAEALGKSADLAMCLAKQNGGNCFTIFTPDMDARSTEYMAIANSLHRAIEKQEFCVYYQPIFTLASRKILGVEALVRWQHPQMGIVSPNRFIHIAEELGIINELGEWVLGQVAADLGQYHLLGERVSVNISTLQLLRGDRLVHFLNQLLSAHGISGDRLELEITESSLLQRSETVINNLHRLREMGIRISIDDFGTGYCSLGYLRDLPLDGLKIDRSFIANLEHSHHDQAIVKTILELARSLNLTVTAEGVESPAQLAFLQQHNCQKFQGFLMTPPLPVEKFIHYAAELG